MAKEFEAVIFDLDGVICFTDEHHYLAWKEMADGIGVYFDKEINNRLRGVSRMASLEIILERCDEQLSDARKEELAAQKNDIYRKLLARMSPADLSDEVKNSLVSSGSIINGYVENSLIFKSVFVGERCYIKNSIIMNDVYLGDNVHLENCIVESGDTIRPNAYYVGENGIKIIDETDERYTL